MKKLRKSNYLSLDRVKLGGILICTLLLSNSLYAVDKLADVAKQENRSVNRPKYSEVCLSSRWERPRSTADPQNTFTAINDFHPTWLVWCYSTDKIFVDKCRAAGINKVNLSVDATMGYPDSSNAIIRDEEGDPVKAPWYTWADSWWGCANNTVHRQNVLDRVKACVDAGANSIQFDGYRVNAEATKWYEGQCTCKDCLGNVAQDYALVRTMYDYIKTEINKKKGGIYYTCNNFNVKWEYPVLESGLFYLGIGELYDSSGTPLDIGAMYHRYKSGRENWHTQIVTYANKEKNPDSNRRVIGFSYANGVNPVVPWDVYLDGGGDRFFGGASSYAHLYGFVRSMPWNLDGYEDACAVGPGITDSRYPSGSFPIKKIGGNGETGLFMRAKPKSAGNNASGNEPIVVHLVEMVDETTQYSVKISRERLFANTTGAIKVSFCRPRGYSESEHDAAQSSNNFSPLKSVWSKTVVEPASEPGYFRIFMAPGDLTPYIPWGYLVIELI